MSRSQPILLGLMVMFLTPALTAHAIAQGVADFYRGKTLSMIIGSGAGGGSDVFSRVFSRYLTKHMPGHPRIIVQNLPAAGGVVAAQEIFNTAPRDGTVLGSVMRTIPFMPLLTEQKVSYDANKMNWLGSLNRETNVIVTWHTSPSKTLDDIFRRRTVVGTSGFGSDSQVYTQLLNRTLGTKFDLVGGYKGGPEIDLAMERGEVEGRVSITWTSLKTGHVDWVKNHKVNVIAQLGLRRDPDLPDVPNVLDLVRDPNDRQVFEFLFARQEAGRPYAAPPNVPADRIGALRQAFKAAADDPEFVADIEGRGGSVEFMPGGELQSLIAQLYETSPQVLKAVRQALEN